MRKFRPAVLTGMVWMVAFAASAAPAPDSSPTAAVYRRVAEQVDSNLRDQVLDHWFPIASDPHGGFHEKYNSSWQLLSPDPVRSIVYQSRLTWTASQAIKRFPGQADMYRFEAEHGLTFLVSKLWDHQHGGFFWDVDVSGKPYTAWGQLKIAYGNAFGIYAAAANFRATGDPAALDLAQKAFRWYDASGHDAVHGGYFEVVQEHFAGAPRIPPEMPNPIGGRFGQKSMNTSIHLLEALTELYQAWPDPVLRQRLEEMFHLVRDRIYAEPGDLVMFFTPDWQPQPTHDSYGHDVETAYLLIEAAQALGMGDDEKTWRVARSLVDHALKVAVNPAGGLYNAGDVEGGNYEPDREWWTQAEWLNALLLMHQRYGPATLKYWDAFTSQWDWIEKVEIDPIGGGWFAHVSNENHGEPGPKSDRWTDCYHQGRALMNVSARLRRLAESAATNADSNAGGAPR